jgi:ribosomal-protein-alanine N-acetyltransferase
MKAGGRIAFSLRPYRRADFGRLCEIDVDCFGSQVAFDPKQMWQTLKEKGAFAIVAETAEAEMAGFIVARKAAATRGRVITLDVLPQFRKQGLGAKLMRAAEDRFQKAGIKWIRLETAKHNRAAQALYEKLGFTRVGEIQGYYPDGSDAWIMRKDLPAARSRVITNLPAGALSVR